MIPFNKIDNRKYIKPYLKKVKEFIESGNYILDKSVEDFETHLKAISGYKYASMVSNGADGLYMALKSLNIGSGDEVITQGTAYNASVTAILRTGAKPRFADIDKNTWTIDWFSVAKLINSKTKAILPVWLYGNERDIPFAVPRVVEDACQCDIKQSDYIRVHSFYPTKPLGSLGDAGAVFMNDTKVYQSLNMLRNLGQEWKNKHTLEGYNMRPSSLQALFLGVKEGNDVNWILERYRSSFTDLDTPKVSGGSGHIFPIRVNNRDEFRRKMLKAGIETAIHYPTIVYKQPFWKGKYDECPISEWLLDGIVSLPIYPSLTKKEVDYIIEKTLEYAS